MTELTRPTLRATPVASELLYVAREALLILLLVYVFLFAGTSAGIVNHALTRIGMVVLTIAVAIYWITGLVRSRAAPAPLGGWTLLFLAAYTITALTSMDPRRSLGEVWLSGLYIFIVFLSAALVRWGWPRELVIKCALIAGGLLLGMGWYSAFEWYRGWLQLSPGEWLPTIAYRLPAPNTYAVFLNLLLMPALARWLFTRERVPRVLLSVWMLAALGILFLTSSRGGWMGCAAGIAVVLGVHFREALPRAGWATVIEAIKRHRAQLALLALIVVLLIVAGGGLLLRQLDQPTRGGRFEFWSVAWAAFLESPLVGRGPFTFGSAYAAAWHVPPGILFIHAHSVLFNLLAETGLVGTLAFAALVIAALQATWRQTQRLSGYDRAVALGVFGSLIAASVHGLVEVVAFEPVNAMLIAMLLGVALAPASPAPVVERQAVQTLWPKALSLLLVMVGWYGIWLSEPLHTGVEAANRNEWQRAAAEFASAAQRDPRSAVVHQQLGLAYSQLALAGDESALRVALTAFETATRLDPEWSPNHANLGRLYAAHGDRKAALRELRRTVEISPNAPIFWLNLGEAAERLGDGTTAHEAYVRTLQLRPDWAGAYFWRATEARRAALAQASSGPNRVAPLTIPQLQQAVLASSLGKDYVALASAHLEAGQLAEAERAAGLAGLAHFAIPEERLEFQWVKAQLAAAQFDYASALALGEQALNGYRFQSAFGPGAFGDRSYGPYLFRRESMAADLVPQFVVIVLTDEWAQRQIQIGRWAEAAGDEAQAQGWYRAVLELVPDNAEAARLVK